MMGEKQADIYVEVREMEREDGADVSRRACPEAGEEPLRLLLLVEPVCCAFKTRGPHHYRAMMWHCLQPAAGEITSHALNRPSDVQRS
jgi:hypothetical protein